TGKRDDVPAHCSLDPLPVGVEEADHGDRSAGQPRGIRGQLVEERLTGSVIDATGRQSLQPRRIRRHRRRLREIFAHGFEPRFGLPNHTFLLVSWTVFCIFVRRKKERIRRMKRFIAAALLLIPLGCRKSEAPAVSTGTATATIGATSGLSEAEKTFV